MKRWGMLEDGEMPEPNINIRLAIQWLDHYSDDMSLSILGTVIPMLEVALDGALLKFLLEEVHDPVCHQVFEKINNDESRHIAVDFEVLNMIGNATARRLAVQFVGNVASPGVIIGALMYAPLLNRMRNNIVEMGLEPERLYNAMKRFRQARRARRVHPARADLPAPQVPLQDGGQPEQPLPLPGQLDGVAVRPLPQPLLSPIPTWFKELTYEPAA